MGKLISHFWLTKYRIRKALELLKKEIVKHPSLSVNPDNQALDNEGKIANGICSTWFISILPRPAALKAVKN